MMGIISVVIGDHFGGGDNFDGGDHFGGGTLAQVRSSRRVMLPLTFQARTSFLHINWAFMN